MVVKESAAALSTLHSRLVRLPASLNRGLHGPSLPSWGRHRGVGADPIGVRMSPLIGDDPRGGMLAIDNLDGEEQGLAALAPGIVHRAAPESETVRLIEPYTRVDARRRVGGFACPQMIGRPGAGGLIMR